MNLALLVYLASISEGVKSLLAVGGMFLLFTPIFTTIVAMWCKDFSDSEAVANAIKLKRKVSLPAFIVGLICIPLSVLIPSEKTIYIMAGVYATEQIVTNTKVQKIGNDVLEVIESKLDKMKDKE